MVLNEGLLRVSLSKVYFLNFHLNCIKCKKPRQMRVFASPLWNCRYAQSEILLHSCCSNTKFSASELQEITSIVNNHAAYAATILKIYAVNLLQWLRLHLIMLQYILIVCCNHTGFMLHNSSHDQNLWCYQNIDHTIHFRDVIGQFK